MKKQLLTLFLLALSFAVCAQSELKVFPDWLSTTGSQNFFYKNVTKTDGSNNVYVAGATMNGSGNYDILVAKYNSSGVQQWIKQYNGAGNGNDMATGLYIDGSGNVYITGTVTTATNIDVITIKYNSSGTQQWLSTYDGTGSGIDCGADVTVDASSNVYITGSSINATPNYDAITIKYNSSGTQQWASRYNNAANLDDAGVKVAINGSNVVVSGLSHTNPTRYGYSVITYNASTGAQVSVNLSIAGNTGIDQVNDMVITSSGNIYIAGATPVTGQGYDFDIIKLNSNLSIAWQNTYNSGSSYDDIATGIKVDASGNVYVCGTSTSSSQGKNITTIKYNSSGTQQWLQTYNGSTNGDDEANAMAIDASGNIYITGYTTTAIDKADYLTIKYNSSGTELWTTKSDGDAHLNDMSTNIVIDGNGDIVVTGQSETEPNTYQYCTVKYVERQIITPTDYNSESPMNSFQYYLNKGQVVDTQDSLVPTIRYYVNNSSPEFFIKKNSCSFVFAKVDTSASTTDTLHRIDLTFDKVSSTAKTYAMGEKSSYLNYFLGQCPRGITEVHGNERLITYNLYPNIDLMYSSNQNGIKYYFIIKPGATPTDLQLIFSGATSFNLDGSTNALTISSTIGSITFERPTAYQLSSANVIIPITGWQCAWQTNGATNKYKFYTSTYDNAKALIIQVDLGHTTALTNSTAKWSTYFGGSGDDFAYDITNDQHGNIYVVGQAANSINFPIYISNTQGNFGGGTYDAFIAKFNRDYEQKWTSYYGGNSIDMGTGIAFDESIKKIYFCGHTSSDTSLHTKALTGSANSYVDHYGGDKGFIARIDTAGHREWATFFGQRGTGCEKIKVDASGNIYVVGSVIGYGNATTGCTAPAGGGFTVCNPSGAFNQFYYYGGPVDGYDGFIARFNTNTELTWSTLFGGQGDDYFNNLAIDNDNNKLYVVGGTTSLRVGTPNCTANSGFPLCNAGGFYLDSLNGSNYGSWPDGFITRFSLTNASLEWSTFFGGIGEDGVTGVDVANGNLYVSGFTATGFYGNDCAIPVNNGFPKCYSGTRYGQSFGGVMDAFISKFNLSTNLTWSSFVGGGGGEGPEVSFAGPKVKINGNGDVFIFGTTRSGSMSNISAFPTMSNYSYFMQSSHGDNNGAAANTDNFLIAFNSSDQQIWGTYFGGTGWETAMSPRFGDLSGGITTYQDRVYVCGSTYSTSNFPFSHPSTANPYYQEYTTISSSKKDAFIADLRVGTTGINDTKPQTNNILSIYPNPSNGSFVAQFTVKSGDKAEIEIYDILGKQVKSISGITGSGLIQVPVDLSLAPSGVYFVHLLNSTESSSAKIIIQ